MRHPECAVAHPHAYRQKGESMFEHQGESAIDLSALFEQAAERDPELSPFCIVCCDQGVHARGRFAVFWFDSVSDLTGFLRQVVPVMAEERFEEIVSEVSDTLAGIDQQGLLEEHVNHLAELLGGALQFRWAGCFDDLCAGPPSAACELRALVRAAYDDRALLDEHGDDDEQTPDEDPEREIGGHEIDAFAVFLNELRR